MTTSIRILMALGAISLAPAHVVASSTAGGSGRDATEAGTLFGPVILTQSVRANGTPLAPGTYWVRVTEEVSDQDQWVEFLDGSVVGRELATVIPSGEISTVAKLRPPLEGGVRVDALRGADYVRVWINDARKHYLIHLPLK